MRILLIMAIAVVGLRSQANGQALLENGDFETPQFSTSQDFTGKGSFGGWRAFSTGGKGNAGLVVGSGFGLSPHSGTQTFCFNGNNPPPGSWIEQTFQTVAGAEYRVVYHVGRNGDSGEKLKLSVQIFDSDSKLLASAENGAPPTGVWVRREVSFTAASSTSRLRFTDVSDSNPMSGLYLDTISVAPATRVPRPADVFVQIPDLVLRNGDRLGAAQIVSFNPTAQRVMVRAGKTLRSVPLADLPEETVAKLKEQAAPATPAELQAAAVGAAQDTERSNATASDRSERAQPRLAEGAHENDRDRRALAMREREAAQEREAKLMESLAELALKAALDHLDAPRAGSGMPDYGIAVSERPNFAPPTPIQGWSNRYRVSGTVTRQFALSTGSFTRRQFRVDVELEAVPGQSPRVLEVSAR